MPVRARARLLYFYVYFAVFYFTMMYVLFLKRYFPYDTQFSGFGKNCRFAFYVIVNELIFHRIFAQVDYSCGSSALKHKYEMTSFLNTYYNVHRVRSDVEIWLKKMVFRCAWTRGRISSKTNPGLCHCIYLISLLSAMMLKVHTDLFLDLVCASLWKT